ncbi:MAG: flagellar biosynthesis protein FlgB [Alphaproteobacteria bacterium]|nr:flagellar biosynthesis protein FlgB [Alphaproteobacteria bacterium]
MDFNNLPLMQMMTKKMSWLSRRTEVIAHNVAHADTPGYRAQDLKKASFSDMVRKEAQVSGFTPVRTNGAHLVGLKPSMPFRTEAAPDSFETSIDDNDVSIEQQLTKLGETQMSYQMTLNLYRKHLEMIRTSLTRPAR